MKKIEQPESITVWLARDKLLQPVKLFLTIFISESGIKIYEDTSLQSATFAVYPVQGLREALEALDRYSETDYGDFSDYSYRFETVNLWNPDSSAKTPRQVYVGEYAGESPASPVYNIVVDDYKFVASA